MALLQAGPGEDPQLFELPPWYVSRVAIKHSDAPWLWDMGIKWSACPLDSSMQLAIGGLTYTAVPYSCWRAPAFYMRAFCSSCCCPAVYAAVFARTLHSATRHRPQ